MSLPIGGYSARCSGRLAGQDFLHGCKELRRTRGPPGAKAPGPLDLTGQAPLSLHRRLTAPPEISPRLISLDVSRECSRRELWAYVLRERGTRRDATMRLRAATARASQDEARGRERWVSAASRTRLIVMLAGGLTAAVVTGFAGAWQWAPLTGWDVTALIFTAWVWLAIGPMTSSGTARHATRADAGRATSDLIVLSAAVASLAAVGYVLVQANSATGARQNLLAGLGVASVVLSWFAVHTLFTLRYARLYYTGKDGGVDFNQAAPPRYLDFAYLAFTVGMTFQVSDTSIQTPNIRATVLRHALLSFLFGAVIVAATVNLLAGLGTGGGH
ncbi:MAG: hypothetical protein JWO57_2625 [Pseudonocardiales bacterium]|nr:hypothetical protein [Pseudonocardiales bacterium]